MSRPSCNYCQTKKIQRALQLSLLYVAMNNEQYPFFIFDTFVEFKQYIIIPNKDLIAILNLFRLRKLI